MRRKLQAKLNSKKGFTLVELLIVVAIIAILVAISIPLVTGSLDKARQATDQANERAARGAAVVDYLTDDTYGVEGSAYAKIYDAEKGTLVSTDQIANVTGYGQCKEHKGGVLKVQIDANGNVSMTWENGGIGGQVTNTNTHGVDGTVSPAGD